jgi:putative phosphoesterase
MTPPSPRRIGVISDTHGFLHPAVFRIFEGVELIIHAGDIGDDLILAELEAIAPVKAVSGNVDGPPASNRPAARQFETFAGRIAVAHGHMPNASARRLSTMLAYFLDFAPGIVVYGHTHLAATERIDGVVMYNPGAAGNSQVGGRSPSVGLISIEAGEPIPRFEHVLLG